MAITKKELTGKAQTVLGLVKPEDLGITLPHEHLLISMAVWFSEPKEASRWYLSRQPVSLENLSWVRSNVYNNLDNVLLLDEEMAAKEVMHFKLAGGNTIVDMTNIGLGRDPLALARISRTTGLNVIMGGGYYVGGGIKDPDFDRKSEDELAEDIVRDILEGVDDTEVHAGVIGEVGCDWPLMDKEKKSLRASAKAQQRTGATINIHPGRHEDSPMEILQVLDKAGADLSRVVMSHLDRTGFLPETRLEMARTRCCLEYDGFGAEPFYPLRFGVFDRPSDVQRIRQIIELIDKGHLNQILISHDICMKIRLVSYGGNGYAYILRYVVPQMLARGITNKEIHTMMVENPKRILVFGV